MLVQDRGEQLLSVLSDMIENKNDVYSRISQQKFPFGDGHAAEKIVEVLRGWQRRSACPWHRHVVKTLSIMNTSQTEEFSNNVKMLKLLQNARIENPSLTIILPVHNGETFLRESLQSIIDQQTSFKFECVVVDDCSTDRTLAIILEMTKQDPRFTIVKHSKNLNLPESLNTGLSISRAHWITWTSDDNIYSVDFAEIMLTKADEFPEAGIITGAYIYIDDKGEQISKGTFLTSHFRKGAYNMVLHWSGSPVFMFPAAAKKIVGAFNSKLLSVEDADHLIRILEYFPTYVSATDATSVVMKYRKHNETLTVQTKHIWAEKWSLLCGSVLDRGNGRLNPWRMLPHARYSLNVEADESRYASEMASMLPSGGIFDKRCVPIFREKLSGKRVSIPNEVDMTDIQFQRSAHLASLRFKFPKKSVLVVIANLEELATSKGGLKEKLNPLNIFGQVNVISFPGQTKKWDVELSSVGINVVHVTGIEDASRKIQTLSPNSVHGYGGLNCKRAVDSNTGNIPVICSVDNISDCCAGSTSAVFIWSSNRKVAVKLIEAGVQRQKVFGFYTKSPPASDWAPQMRSSEILQRWQVSLFRIALDQFKRQ